jgi:AcrR family transcriptional regulator
MKSNAASTKRQAVLEAASQIVLEHGVTSLTLDSVAQHAGVSKGGLLYHFPSKDALIAAMVDHLATQFTQSLDQERTRDTTIDDPGHFLRAYIHATFGLEQRLSTLSAGLLAAVASNPALLDPLREHFRTWQDQTEQSGLDPALATIIRLAVDGLWFAELLGFAPPDQKLRRQVASTLLALTQTTQP